jgi:hypothetical protein
MEVYKKPKEQKLDLNKIVSSHIITCCFVMSFILILQLILYIYDIKTISICILALLPFIWMVAVLVTIKQVNKTKKMSKNVIEWLDIVKIKDSYHLVRCPIKLESIIIPEEVLENHYLGNRLSVIEKTIHALIEYYKAINIDTNLEINLEGYEDDTLYNCDEFYELVKTTFKLSDNDEIETVMLDGIDVPKEVAEKYDIAYLGGYINGVNY